MERPFKPKRDKSDKGEGTTDKLVIRGVSEKLKIMGIGTRRRGRKIFRCLVLIRKRQNLF